MYIGGLDIGTSSCKLTVYDHLGNYAGTNQCEYNSNHSHGLHEIDANEILKAVGQVIAATPQKLTALGVSSFGETFVLTDRDGHILTHSMLYTDPRGEEERSVFDPEFIQQVCGCTPHEMYSIPKLMWIKKHRPSIFKKTKHVFLIADYIIYMLTGQTCIDYSLAARTMGFDIEKKEWCSEIFSTAGIDSSLFSTPVPGGTLVGVSNQFGLCDTQIAVGFHDQVATSIGAGAIEPGSSINGSGSVECITPIFNSLPHDRTLCENGFAIVPFPNGQYICYAFSFTGGTALRWFRDHFAEDLSYHQLDLRIGENPSGILCLPHFSGAATPYMDTSSKAVFCGITLETTKEMLYRSIMEGVAFEMKVNFDTLSASGIQPKRLTGAGGGAKSEIWLQMKADILGVPITAVNTPEAGALGTIMGAAAAIGIADLNKAKEIYIKEGKTYTPDSHRHKEYMVHYEKYKRLYKAAKSVMAD